MSSRQRRRSRASSFLVRRSINRGEGPCAIQDCQLRGVAMIRLHAIARPARHQGRLDQSHDTLCAVRVVSSLIDSQFLGRRFPGKERSCGSRSSATRRSLRS